MRTASSSLGILAAGILLLVAAGCNRPDCSNSDPVFNRFAPDAIAYKEELVRHLQAEQGAGLRFWLDKYVEKDGQTFLNIHIQGAAVCAKGLMLVKDWRKLEGIKSTKGAGYSGAELKGLKITVQRTTDDITLVYKDISQVVD